MQGSFALLITELGGWNVVISGIAVWDDLAEWQMTGG
jgi:hypothetical protein